jgi:hypothetical protein
VETTVSASGSKTRVWYRLAIVYFVVATALGLYMGMTGSHGLVPVHAHLNLLGWASLALTGILYDRFPAATTTRLYPIHFWVYNITLPVAMLSLALLLLRGNEALVPVVGIVSLVLFASIVVFAANIWRSSAA